MDRKIDKLVQRQINGQIVIQIDRQACVLWIKKVLKKGLCHVVLIKLHNFGFIKKISGKKGFENCWFVVWKGAILGSKQLILRVNGLLDEKLDMSALLTVSFYGISFSLIFLFFPNLLFLLFFSLYKLLIFELMPPKRKKDEIYLFFFLRRR